MTQNATKLFTMTLAAAVLLAGCATTRPRKAETADLAGQVQSLQAEVAAKDQQIQDLQYQLESQQGSPSSTGSYKSSGVIRVPGVTAKDVQRALVRAGFDPGPVDGKIGKQTKSAIKRFQRKNNLKADGIVGERTWSYLR